MNKNALLVGGRSSHDNCNKYQLDGDGSGVLDREEWTKWWVQRWKANPSLAEKGLCGEERGETSGDNNSDDGGQQKVKRLAELARRARWRAGTDIHTAAWKGDLALVQVSWFVADEEERGCLIHCGM